MSSLQHLEQVGAYARRNSKYSFVVDIQNNESD